MFGVISDIFKAIFGATTYQYQAFFVDRKGAIVIDAEDFIDAQIQSRTMSSYPIAYIVPLESVVGTDGERGANMYLYSTVANASVFGENAEQAKENFKNHLNVESVKIIEVQKPIWVNKKYYKGQ